MKKFISSILAVAMIFCSATFMCGCDLNDESHVTRDDWSDDVKTAVNDLIDMYGDDSENYNENSYVVSDFDNTTSIFDGYEQVMIYQAEVMGYEFTPEELPAVLSSGLSDMNEDLSAYGYGNGSYNDWISDITTAYEYLYETYGPFDADGTDNATAKKMHKDAMWSEFAAKMMDMYLLVEDNEATEVSYPWVTYWYTGMTDDELYSLAKKAQKKYSKVDTAEKTISTSEEIDSRVGPTEYTYAEGIQVTENIKEMWKKLDDAGIDVWICTASDSNVVRAAVDAFGMHDSCTGIIGMTPAKSDGELSYTYDYETGYAWYAEDDGEWKRGNVTSGVQPVGIGKTVAIQNICEKEYGCGPIAGFMDSTGDYNFCTEFASLKLVICFNTATRGVTNGGSVIAELAMYQKNELGYNLAKTNKTGDTLYVLQGRDENGKRTFRNSNSTIKFGETEEKLYCDEQNEAVYNYIVANKMKTADVINTFAIRTEAGAEGNKLGFTYGFLDSYDGYHSK